MGSFYKDGTFMSDDKNADDLFSWSERVSKMSHDELDELEPILVIKAIAKAKGLVVSLRRQMADKSLNYEDVTSLCNLIDSL